MSTKICELYERLEKSVNLLIVDDDEGLLDTVKDLFRSPLFSITTVSSSLKAQRMLLEEEIPWHCCIFDIAMEHEDSGLRLLEKIPRHPAALILSGLGSMNMASRATIMGAQAVIDKNPAMIDTIVNEVSRLAPIGYLLKGKSCPYQSLFSLISHRGYDHPDQWAGDACITFRQLQRVCAQYSSFTPRMVLAHYYGIRFLLEHSKEEVFAMITDESMVDHVRNSARIARSLELISKDPAGMED